MDLFKLEKVMSVFRILFALLMVFNGIVEHKPFWVTIGIFLFALALYLRRYSE